MQQNKKVAFVTGGSRGIGRAIVEHFKENGWQVATCATSERGLKDSVADFTFQCNVQKPNEVKEGIQKTLRTLHRIDILINNAGLSGENSMKPDTSDDLWHQILDTNLNGTYYVCKYGSPYLPDHTGRIINMGSVLSLKGVPDAIAYCAAKHGVLGLTRALAHALAPRGITVNAVCPGWTRTDMAEQRIKEIGISEAEIAKHVPLGRMIEPKEIADLVYFLASSRAGAMMTGQALTADGGTLA